MAYGVLLSIVCVLLTKLTYVQSFNDLYCHGEVINSTCPDNSKIHINAVWYTYLHNVERPQNCRHPLVRNSSNYVCSRKLYFHHPGMHSIFIRKCNGKQRCEPFIANTTIDHTCNNHTGPADFLNISYSCVPDVKTTNANDDIAFVTFPSTSTRFIPRTTSGHSTSTDSRRSGRTTWPTSPSGSSRSWKTTTSSGITHSSTTLNSSTSSMGSTGNKVITTSTTSSIGTMKTTSPWAAASIFKTTSHWTMSKTSLSTIPSTSSASITTSTSPPSTTTSTSSKAPITTSTTQPSTTTSSRSQTSQTTLMSTPATSPSSSSSAIETQKPKASEKSKNTVEVQHHHFIMMITIPIGAVICITIALIIMIVLYRRKRDTPKRKRIVNSESVRYYAKATGTSADNPNFVLENEVKIGPIYLVETEQGYQPVVVNPNSDIAQVHARMVNVGGGLLGASGISTLEDDLKKEPVIPAIEYTTEPMAEHEFTSNKAEYTRFDN